MILPAVNGTVGILESAFKLGSESKIKRIVILSSTAALHSLGHFGPVDESMWNTVDIDEVNEKGKEAAQVSKYTVSKSLSEKAAWDYFAIIKGQVKWDLVALNPPFIFGPIIHEAVSEKGLGASAAYWFYNVVKGVASSEELATFQTAWVDVRDVGTALYLALSIAAAGGERIYLSESQCVWQDWCKIDSSFQLPSW